MLNTKLCVVGALMLVGLCISAGITAALQYKRANALERDNAALMQGVIFQNEAIKANEVNLTRLAELPIKLNQNRTVYRDRVQVIKSYEKDINATDCANAIGLLRTVSDSNGLL